MNVHLSCGCGAQLVLENDQAAFGHVPTSWQAEMNYFHELHTPCQTKVSGSTAYRAMTTALDEEKSHRQGLQESFDAAQSTVDSERIRRRAAENKLARIQAIIDVIRKRMIESEDRGSLPLANDFVALYEIFEQ